MTIHSEIGRELKVSELQPRKVVWVCKKGRAAMATLWVIAVSEKYVVFYAGVTHTEFYALRTGPDLDEISDDSHIEMKIFEYLGEV